MSEIRALQSAGQFDSSIGPLRVLLATHSRHPEANYRLGIALVQTGRRSLAIWPLQKAAQSEQYAIQAGVLLATTLLTTKDFEEAIRAADRVLEIDPERIAALYSRAHANIGAGNPEEALRDADHILELRPDDATGYAIRAGALLDLDRVEEAEQSQIHLKELAAAGDDPDKAARACAALGVFQASQSEKEAAEATFTECVEKYPTHPVVQQYATEYYITNERPEKAIEIWRRAVEENPEDLSLRSKLAGLLVEQKREEEAEALMKETVELFDTAQAWQMLASHHRNTGNYSEAVAAIDEAIARARRPPPTLRFAQADLLILEGELDRAEEIATALEEPSYRNLLLGNIKLARGDAEGALRLLESGLRLWPNNPGARFVAGKAAQKSGDLTRALAEYREAVRIDETATDAALEIARINYALGRWVGAQQFAERHIQRRPFEDADAHIIAARSAAAQGNIEHAKGLLENLRSVGGQDATAAVELAGIMRKAQGPLAAAAVIESSGLDLTLPENAPALRSLVEDMIEVGKTAQALRKVEQALRAHPDIVANLDLLARVLMQQKRLDEARVALEKAIAIDGEYARALEARGTLATMEGDLQASLDYFDRAAQADDSDSDYAYRLAQVNLMLGRNAEAIEALSDAVYRNPGNVGACNDLAWLLADTERDLDSALELAIRASELGRSHDTLDTLGWVHFKRGDTQQAIEAFEAALALRPSSPSVRYRLGLALAAKGNSEGALAALREALEVGSFPEVEAARAELARLEGS